VSRDKVILILLLAVVVALAVVAWGLAGGQPSRSDGSLMRGDGKTWMEEVIADVHDSSIFPKPAPTQADELAAGDKLCLAAGTIARVATVAVNQPCAVAVAKRDGTRTRKLHLSLTEGGKLKVTFAARGGLPGKPKDVVLPQTLENAEGDDETRRDIDLRVPEDGADVTLTCQAGGPCKVAFDGLLPATPAGG
jgi:hypothetical protein